MGPCCLGKGIKVVRVVIVGPGRQHDKLVRIDFGGKVRQAGEPHATAAVVLRQTGIVGQAVSAALGDLRGNELEVFGGLDPGDQVVVAGVSFLRDGMAAEVWKSTRGEAR